jgi:hypothetical protein
MASRGDLTNKITLDYRTHCLSPAFKESVFGSDNLPIARVSPKKTWVIRGSCFDAVHGVLSAFKVPYIAF